MKPAHLKIAQLVSRRQRRGAEVFAADLSTALAERGHDVSFIGLQAAMPAPLTPAGVTCEDLASGRQSKLSFSLVRALSAQLRSQAPEVVQANGGYALKYAVLARRWSRAKWPVLYCNIGLSSDWLKRPGQRLWNGWLIRQATFTAAVSEASRSDLISTYGLKADKVAVVRRGVCTDSVDREPARQALCKELGIAEKPITEKPIAERPAPEKSIVLLHVGSFTPEKNHAGLLRIFANIRQQSGRPLHLVLVGDGPLRPEIQATAQNDPAVQFLGVRSDVSQLMAAADLLLLPSLTEGIPGVILEAGAQSLPTVAYDVGGVREVVKDGQSGRLISPGEERCFEQAALELCQDDNLRRRTGSAAREHVLAGFSLLDSVNRFESICQTMAHA